MAGTVLVADRSAVRKQHFCLTTCLLLCDKSPQTQRPKTTNTYYLIVPEGQELGNSLAGVLRGRSWNVAEAAVSSESSAGAGGAAAWCGCWREASVLHLEGPSTGPLAPPHSRAAGCPRGNEPRETKIEAAVSLMTRSLKSHRHFHLFYLLEVSH